MNHETDTFARWRFTPRTGASKAESACAVEHFKPAPRGNFNIRSHLLAVFIGAALAALILYGV